MSDGMYMLDADLNYVMFNERYRRFLQIPREMIGEGRPVADVVRHLAERGDYGKVDAEAFTEQRVAQLGSGSGSTIELEMPNGSILEFRQAPTKDGGTVVRLTDITERRRAERVLAEKEAMLATTLANMPGGIAYTDADMNIVVSNDRFAEMISLPQELLAPGKSYAEAIRISAEHGMFGEGDIEQIVEARLETMRNPPKEALEVNAPDGRHFSVQRRKVEGGGVVTVATDVTALVEAEELINRQKAILEVTLETMDQGITMFDGDLNMLAYNDNFKRLLEFPIDDFPAGTNMATLLRFNAERGEYGEGDIDEQVAERVELARKFEAHHFERTRPDGKVIEIRGTPLPDRGGMVTTYTDITERKRMEQAIRESEQRLFSILQESPISVALILGMHRIIQTFLGQDRKESLSDDGLELGAVFLPADRRALTFAGAGLSLYVQRDGEIDEIKDHRKAIGYRRTPQDIEFTNHTFEAAEGMDLIMTTDGLPTQVGGDPRLPIGKRGFVHLLDDLRDVPMDRKGAAIMAALDRHQGAEPQRDDISLLGIGF